MAIKYATPDQFTEVYSLKGITSEDINDTWLPHGALRINEELGGCFITPFSSNNQTATDLSIRFAYLGILERTRNQTDAAEMRISLLGIDQDGKGGRIGNIKRGNSPMITTSGDSFFADDGSVNDVWGNHDGYKPVFDMRDPMCQRVDPDRIDDENLEDI